VAVRRLVALLLAVPAAALDPNPAVLGVIAVERDGKVFVAEAVAGTPAAGAGLRANDLLLSIDGKEIRRAADVDRALEGKKPGDEVRVSYRRGETDVAEARAKLAERRSVQALKPRKRGETKFEAPAWHAYGWANVEEKNEPSPAAVKGKVVVIHGFQSWCPECARRGFPVMKQVEDELKGADDVALLHVQTVFEEPKENTPERGPKEAAKYGIKAPVGFDARVDGAGQSLLMERFGMAGTSWTIVIDKQGIVRFNGFTPAQSKTIVALVQDLRKG
jgi:membrane-associated protease RseP (regulator of RpoE activity)